MKFYYDLKLKFDKKAHHWMVIDELLTFQVLALNAQETNYYPKDNIFLTLLLPKATYSIIQLLTVLCFLFSPIIAVHLCVPKLSFVHMGQMNDSFLICSPKKSTGLKKC